MEVMVLWITLPNSFAIDVDTAVSPLISKVSLFEAR